jgi:hypothetical protein
MGGGVCGNGVGSLPPIRSENKILVGARITANKAHEVLQIPAQSPDFKKGRRTLRFTRILVLRARRS